MGTFSWPLRISSMDGQQAQDIEATVDTGAVVSPRCQLRAFCGIWAVERRRASAGFCWPMDGGSRWTTGKPVQTIDGESVTTLVVFGEDHAPALLGAYTLEGLALAVDPVEQRLIPTHLIMY